VPLSRGGTKEEREWKRQEKEEAYQAQLDVLKRRKSGAWQKVLCTKHLISLLRLNLVCSCVECMPSDAIKHVQLPLTLQL
jgi:hypothetical protein